MPSQATRAHRFRELHQRPGVFVIPNPWDAGSASMLAALGFEALATTSAGFANTLGRRDGKVALGEKIEHCRMLCAATALPVSADLENGFADDPAQAAANLLVAAESGIVGSSIEDYSGDPLHPIYDFAHAVERVAAAAEALHALPYPFTLTARAENHLRGRDDLDDTVRRLQAFAAAGADVLYAPGLTTLDQVRQVSAAVNRPINVLAPFIKGATVADFAAAGAKRLSIGGTLARVAVTAMLRAGREMLDPGSFAWSDGIVATSEVERMLATAAASAGEE